MLHDKKLQTAPQVGTAPQVYIIPDPGGRREHCENYLGRASQVLGITRVVCGVLCVLLQASAIGKLLNTDSPGEFRMKQYAYSSSGLWCGVLYVVGGSFGIAAGRLKSFRLIVANKVLAIISASICGPTMLIVNMIATDAAYQLLMDYKNDPGFVAIFALLTCAAIVVVFCDVFTTIICCKEVGCTPCCCTCHSPYNTTEPIFATTVDGQQVVLVTSQSVHFVNPSHSHADAMELGKPLMPPCKSDIRNTGSQPQYNPF